MKQKRDLALAVACVMIVLSLSVICISKHLSEHRVTIWVGKNKVSLYSETPIVIDTLVRDEENPIAVDGGRWK